MRLPKSCRKSIPVVFVGPSDSMANGMKSCVAGRFAYFARLRSAACSAAPPVVEGCRRIYEDAHVRIAVASHATYLPLDHGISVAPSGLLPSVRIRPGGSLELGIPAFERALQMMSLMAACPVFELPGVGRVEPPTSPCRPPTSDQNSTPGGRVSTLPPKFC